MKKMQITSIPTIFFVFSVFSVSSLFAQSPADQTVRDHLGNDYAVLESLYLDLHQHPELSYQEKETSLKLASKLRQMGFELTENVGGHRLPATD